jgi:hypothetical protein
MSHDGRNELEFDSSSVLDLRILSVVATNILFPFSQSFIFGVAYYSPDESKGIGSPFALKRISRHAQNFPLSRTAIDSSFFTWQKDVQY